MDGGCMTDWRLGNAQVIKVDADDKNARLHSPIKSHRYGNCTRKLTTHDSPSACETRKMKKKKT